MPAVPPIVAPGRCVSLQTLARAEVTLVGRPIAVDGERVAFDGSVAAGDSFAARIRTMVDEPIRRRSSIMFGFPDDAETVADAVRGHLTGRQR